MQRRPRYVDPDGVAGMNALRVARRNRERDLVRTQGSDRNNRRARIDRLTGVLIDCRNNAIRRGPQRSVHQITLRQRRAVLGALRLRAAPGDLRARARGVRAILREDRTRRLNVLAGRNAGRIERLFAAKGDFVNRNSRAGSIDGRLLGSCLRGTRIGLRLRSGKLQPAGIELGKRLPRAHAFADAHRYALQDTRLRKREFRL